MEQVNNLIWKMLSSGSVASEDQGIVGALRRAGGRIYQEWKGGMDWKNITLIVGQQTCEEFFLLMFL